VIEHPKRILWTAILVAWTFDFLFWKKSPGISFAIFVGITLGAGFLLARAENKRPASHSWWLLIPITIFTVGTFLRREPFTSFANYMLVLVLMGVFVHTFSSGRWFHYSLSDYIALFFYIGISSLAKPIEILSQKKTETETVDSKATPPARWRRTYPILRGLLIAIPIIAIFASLFSAADPIFAEYLQAFIKFFELENLPEYIFRGVYILFLGYLLTGIYLHAFTNTKEETLIGEEKPWLPPFLGFTEAAIVLGSVNILFASFVGVQFRYFFGGQANIKINGYTYAEYARRGFGELVAVAVISLLLFLGLSNITRREAGRQRKTFSGLGIGLVILVAVILVSAFQRLLLYEQAYGFTRLRTYSHIFMAWLGVLLAAVVVLELLKAQRSFALATLIAASGFALTLNAINVDGLIVRQNIQRAIQDTQLSIDAENGQGSEEIFDSNYLHSLSTDATPALLGALENQRLSQEFRNELAGVLACQITTIADKSEAKNWKSYHWADARAWKLLKDHRRDFSPARVFKNEYGFWWVMVNGERRPCIDGAYESY